ncbi:protoheme IX farnesyltransferase (Heme O synthase) (HemeB farnesyltransferase) (plasmid) [Thermomicrobium roseum DSM 5159]|uniref:Protoheme IX farnesyltransferase n=2 Tax=Thermomicrobium roseum TaxID=500 RepID=B9L3N1_THERP|nr:protoheme IX farnesyltransferase (Heme O synthase) (HemeB farnesyltransferase) [Thermomicrobium roseum DSM 5159]
MREMGEGRQSIRWLALAVAIAGYLLIVIGGTVRVTGAGLGCGPEWPLCNGRLVPGWDLLAWIEYVHRLIALAVILLTGAVAVASWRARSPDRWMVRLPLIAAGLVLVQAMLGAITVWTHLEAAVVALHLGVALSYLAVALVLAFRTWFPALARVARRSPLRPWLVAALGAVFLLMLSGAYTAKRGAGFACPEWPFCGGFWIPTGWTNVDVHLTHRLIALVAVLLVAGVAWKARRVRGESRWAVGLATAAAVLMVAQVFVGAANIWFRLHPAVSVAHLAVATIVWVLLVLAVLADRALASATVQQERAAVRGAMQRPLGEVVRDYLVLTKPGVMVLLLVTTLCAMLVAAQGVPSLWTLFWTLVGGALASGGAGAINHYVDRDIDAIMTRTRRRPLPAGRVAPEYALLFGIVLSVLAVYVLTAFVNPVAAVLSLSGNLFYVFVYTIWLKRTTPQNIVIGGAAGAVPPLVGWAAVTGQVSVPALLMFLLVFAWTPPHFWALALYKRGDYAAAGVPMLPAVRGEEETRRQILAYTVAMVLASLLFYPLGVLGVPYLVAAMVLGARFLWLVARLYRERSDQLAKRVFLYSMQYLGLLFAAMVIDAVVF